MKRKLGEIGKITAQTIFIIALVAVVGYLAYTQWYLKRGSVDISLGYTLADGTEVELTGKASMVLYADPQTLRWYKDSSKTQQITGIWGKVSVNPTTDLSDSTIDITWDREVWGTVEHAPGRGSGTTTVPPNVSTTIEDSKYIRDLPGDTPLPPATYTWTWKYDVTATATDPSVGTRTASDHAEGSITAYWTPDGTLTVTASVTTGYIQIVK